MTTLSVTPQRAGWTVDATTFAARLALIRQRQGWNVKEAARECGLPAESWRRWERDGREPHRLTLIAKQIAAATGCDYLWLLLGPDRGEGGLTTGYSVKPIGERLVTTAGESRLGSTVRRPQQRRHPTGLRPVTPLAA